MSTTETRSDLDKSAVRAKNLILSIVLAAAVACGAVFVMVFNPGDKPDRQILLDAIRATSDEMLEKPQSIRPLSYGDNRVVVFDADGKKCAVAFGNGAIDRNAVVPVCVPK